MAKLTYETITSESGFESIKRTADGIVSYIPADPTNSDYQAYCLWAIAEGLMEAPVVVEPEVVEPEPVIGTDPEV